MTQPTGDNADASTQTVDKTPPAPQISDADILAHPIFKAKETELAAAKQETSTWKGRVEKINKTATGEEEKPKDDEKPEQEQPQFVTKQELWERDNKKKIALAGDEFEKLKDELGPGKEETALELALARKGYTTPKAVSDALRQAESSSAPSTVDRSGDTDSRTPEQKRADEVMKITPEDRQKYGQRASQMVTRV